MCLATALLAAAGCRQAPQPGAKKRPAQKRPAPSVFVETFETEPTGTAPRTMAPVVGVWRVVAQPGPRAVTGLSGLRSHTSIATPTASGSQPTTETHVLKVDGQAWDLGTPAEELTRSVAAIYGTGAAPFLAAVLAQPNFPFAVYTPVQNFRGGEISVRFKPINGKIDCAAGIMFNLKPNGDYLFLRADPLDDNLMLFTVRGGGRDELALAPAKRIRWKIWQKLTLKVQGRLVRGLLGNKPYLKFKLPAPVSGKVGLWSKGDSVVLFDDFTVKPAKAGGT